MHYAVASRHSPHAEYAQRGILPCARALRPVPLARRVALPRARALLAARRAPRVDSLIPLARPRPTHAHNARKGSGVCSAPPVARSVKLVVRCVRIPTMPRAMCALRDNIPFAAAHSAPLALRVSTKMRRKALAASRPWLATMWQSGAAIRRAAHAQRADMQPPGAQNARRAHSIHTDPLRALLVRRTALCVLLASRHRQAPWHALSAKPAAGRMVRQASV